MLTVTWIGDNILTFATVMEAVVLAPILFDFVSERRKRRSQVDLSLEVLDASRLQSDIAGLDDLLQDIRDLVDRARHPEPYASLRIGNEILIAGPALSGKKALAKRIARDAGIQRLVIVHNPRNADALAKAKSLIHRASQTKTMLLLPRLDLIDNNASETALVELDALIEAAGKHGNVLVIGTSSGYRGGSEVDNLFGTLLVLPGTTIISRAPQPLSEETHRMLAAVTEHYLNKALTAKYSLGDITRDAFIARILLSATNPAEIEDILGLCQTTALYRQRVASLPAKTFTVEILEIAIRRTIIDHP